VSGEVPLPAPAALPPFPLTKTLSPADYTRLASEAAVVRACAGEGSTQVSEHRVWEYAMALHAMERWVQQDGRTLRTLMDVGGAGSPLIAAATQRYPDLVSVVVDPVVNHPIEQSPGHNSFDVVTAISVLEHVEKPNPFLAACVRHLRPGGLLVLTMDYWNCEGPDTGHFHWMRQRIYNRHSVTDLLTTLREKYKCRRFGETDWTYHGNHVFNYTFLAVTLRKEG
jgi:SAM-dependent methyltransferase